MANQLTVSDSYKEHTNVTKPPFFDGSNYAYWKDRMEIWICSRDLEEWKSIKKGYEHPVDDTSTPISILDLTPEQATKYTNNMKALNSLVRALSASEYNKISAYRTAKEVWDRLENMHEGTTQVKKSKIILLMHEYETFAMLEHEPICHMYERYSVIINNLRRLGKTLSNEEQVERVEVHARKMGAKACSS